MEKHRKKHIYKIGDVVNGLIITELCYQKQKNGAYKKAYKYKCPVCGYECGECYKSGLYHAEHMITESNLKHGSGCVICSRNGVVAPNINSIHALAPHIEKFLINKEDAYKYSPKSSIKIECKCIDCGKKYLRSCSKLTNYGVPCVCGDGFSYPEKFVFNALRQLKIKFKPQFYLNNSKYRYDFYLNDYNIIIEVHGIQHYKQKWERDEVENDKNKKDFAFSCGYTEANYVVLDCRESSLEFIKSSILDSKLSELFSFDNVDFTTCAKFATSNYAKTASELWNDGQTIKDIAEEMSLNKHTIIAYLKQGNENGWCKYSPGDGTKRRPDLMKNLNLNIQLPLSSEEIKKRDTRKRIYRSWSNMKNRCYNIKDKKYNRYGGRGIKVCDAWSDFEVFLDWALMNGYQDKLVLKRINIDKSYCPENCCWVTKSELSNNKSTNRFITFNGETHTLQEWSRITGLDRRVISKRIDKYGWSVEDALTKPVKQQKTKEELLITFDGQKRTLSEWSMVLGIKRETLKSRLCNGWSVEKAFTYDVKHRT